MTPKPTFSSVLNEHAELENLFAKHQRTLLTKDVPAAVATLKTFENEDFLGSIIQLFDDEALFKGLFAHHGLREENLLFPALDACTTEMEREKALRRV